MVTLRLTALAVALPAAVAAWQLQADPCNSRQLDEFGSYLKPASDAKLSRDAPFEFELCTNNPNTKFVSIYLADRTYGEEGAPTQAITIAKELRASGVFINHRFYHGNFKLDKTLLTNGSYWLKVYETYSPNNQGDTKTYIYSSHVSYVN